VLKPSVTVVSASSVDGIKTVVLSRPVAALTAQHYAIPTTPGLIDLITAVGNTEVSHQLPPSDPVVRSDPVQSDLIQSSPI
jgi:hypothetical protein